MIAFLLVALRVAGLVLLADGLLAGLRDHVLPWRRFAVGALCFGASNAIEGGLSADPTIALAVGWVTLGAYFSPAPKDTPQ